MSRRSGLSLPCARLLPLILPILMAACQSQPQSQPGQEHTEIASSWPGYDYPLSESAEQTVYYLDPNATRIDIVVRRDGPLARFGHDHVVTVEDPEGFLLLNEAGAGSRADLRFRLDRLGLDAAEARVRHGLDTEPDKADIEGTRENLMTHVLNAEQWPWATLSLTEFSRQEEHYSAIVTIAINGSTYSTRQPFHLRQQGNGTTVEGFFVLRQTELGIEPFSALGGGLRVADPLEIHFHIEASAR